jgi:hypothetical protein
MTKAKRVAPALALATLLMAAACASREVAPPPGPSLPPEYAMLPDTLVCVIDRSAESGLREISARKRDGGVVLFLDGAIRPLESVHPVDYIAGYAGREQWLRDGEPISLRTDRYARTGGERRIALNLLWKTGEFRGITLFTGRDDGARPNAIYVPTAPGCIFQAYVREDLIQE